MAPSGRPPVAIVEQTELGDDQQADVGQPGLVRATSGPETHAGAGTPTGSPSVPERPFCDGAEAVAPLKASQPLSAPTRTSTRPFSLGVRRKTLTTGS